MTTLSILKDVSELKDVTIRYIPETDRKAPYHRDHEWVRATFHEWSEENDSNRNYRLDDMMVDFALLIFSQSPKTSKEKILNIVKIFAAILYMDVYGGPARQAKSTELMSQLIDKVLNVLKTGKSDKDFVIGHRWADAMGLFKSELNEEQWEVFIKENEDAIEAYFDLHSNYWVKDLIIPLNDIIRKRTLETWWLFFVAILAEYSIDYQMPAHIRNHPLVKEFTDKSAELALSADDYYITKNKIMTNDITTRVISYLNDKKCTLQEAFDNQYEYSLNLYKECNELKDKISGNPEIASDQLNEWMEVCLDHYRRFYPIASIFHELKVNDDQTLRSDVWDKLYNETVNKTNQRLDPHFLYDPSDYESLIQSISK